MRNKTFLKHFSLFMLTCMVIGVALLSATAVVLIFAGGTSLGMAELAGGGSVEGTVTTDKTSTTSPDLLLDVIDQKIVKMRPAATPLDTIMRQIRKVKDVHSLKSEYYAVDIKPFKDTVATGYNTSAGEGEAYATIEVSNIKIWNVDDNALFPTIVGSDGKPFVGHVSKKDNATSTVSIMPLNGPNGTGTMSDKEIVPKVIPLNTPVIRMANAKSELDAQTAPFAVLPGKDFNYMQNFMAQVEESTFQKIHEKEVNWEFSDYEEMNLYDLRARMEYAYLFGVRKMFTDVEDDEVKRTCGGLTRYMIKDLQYNISNNLSNSIFVNWTKQIFADNAGSDEKIGFLGDNLIEKISVIPDIVKQLEAKKTEVKWGITFSVIETNFGKLLLKRHPLLGIGSMGDNGIVLDVQNIEKHVFKRMSNTTLELKKSGQRNADAVVLQEVSCPILRYPATHSLITGI